MSDAKAIDIHYIGQRARVKKSGEEGFVSQARDFLDECYVEFTTDTGEVIWPLLAGDLEVIHGHA
jgi:hypothetical protein